MFSNEANKMTLTFRIMFFLLLEIDFVVTGECSYSVWLVHLQAWSSRDHAGVF